MLKVSVTQTISSGGQITSNLWGNCSTLPIFCTGKPQLKSASLRGSKCFCRATSFFLNLPFLKKISWFAFRSHMATAEGFSTVRTSVKNTQRKKKFIGLWIFLMLFVLYRPSLLTQLYLPRTVLIHKGIHKSIMQIKELLHNSFQPGHKDTLCYTWFPGARGQQRKRKQ